MTTRSITRPAAEPQAAVAAIKQPGPSAPAAQARALWHADGPRARFRGIGERERWGYGVWLFTGLVFGVPESWAGITSPPWPALSDTVGHSATKSYRWLISTSPTVILLSPMPHTS